MATSKRRDDFILIDTGPWVRDVSGPRLAGQVLLWSGAVCLVALGLGWGPLACYALLGLVTGGVMLALDWVNRHDWQWCPACLEKMIRGAVRCPSCGERA